MVVHTHLATKESNQNPTDLLVIVIINDFFDYFLKSPYIDIFAPTIKRKKWDKFDNLTDKCLPSQLYKKNYYKNQNGNFIW